MSNNTAALRRYGPPTERGKAASMTLWVVPADIRAAFAHVFFSQLGTVGFPERIYCNVSLRPLLEAGLRNVMAAGRTAEVRTWDGCYIVRNARGSRSWSMHAWGLAFDINAATNRMGARPTLSAGLVACFTNTGLVWGGTWQGSKVDGMHFEVPARLFI